ncbi:MAG: hypothetical protein IKZ98_00430 [Clostridia bacterium]|nr:hypothetical protein [Clostridia bacterium]
MKELNWKDCFEPAPEAFERSVQRALQTKTEEQHMKRIIPRSAIIAFALILALMATALAFGGDLLNFLHTKDIGEVQIQKPDAKVEYAETGILKEIRVDEAVCDGRSVHMLVTCTADPEKGALLWGFDWYKDLDTLPFAAERAAAPQVYTLNPSAMIVKTGGHKYEMMENLDERYNSAYSISMDITFFVDEMELGDTIDISAGFSLDEFVLNDDNTMPLVESVPYSVTFPVQIAETRVYEATNLPIYLENYKVLSARITRTDMGSYFEIEVEDDYDPEEYENSMVVDEEGGCRPSITLPLHGSPWFHVLDKDGKELPTLTNDWKLLERFSDASEWEHMMIKEMIAVTEIDSSYTIQPRDSGTEELFTPYTLEFVER